MSFKQIQEFLDQKTKDLETIELHDRVDLCTIGIDTLEATDHNVLCLVLYDIKGDVKDAHMLSAQAAARLYFSLERLLGYDAYSDDEDLDEDDDEEGEF